MKKFVVLILVLALVTPRLALAEGQCEDLVLACDALDQARLEQIAGLEQALKTSREQTDKLLEEHEKREPLLGTGESIGLGLLVGLVIGAIVRGSR